MLPCHLIEYLWSPPAHADQIVRQGTLYQKWCLKSSNTVAFKDFIFQILVGNVQDVSRVGLRRQHGLQLGIRLAFARRGRSQAKGDGRRNRWSKSTDITQCQETPHFKVCNVVCSGPQRTYRLTDRLTTWLRGAIEKKTGKSGTLSHFR